MKHLTIQPGKRHTKTKKHSATRIYQKKGCIIFLYYFPSVHNAFSVFHHSLATLHCALTHAPPLGLKGATV